MVLINDLLSRLPTDLKAYVTLPTWASLPRAESNDSALLLREINDHVHELRSPLDSPPSVELVFFHGLQLKRSQESLDGHLDTWIAADGSGLWLNWILEIFPKARIFFISYDAHTHRNETDGNMDMFVTTENLLQCLTGGGAPVGQKQCPVILVGHCIGGLVMKELCVYATKRVALAPTELTRPVQKFLYNLKGLFFYATPHHGTRLAESNTVFSKGILFEESAPLNREAARRNEEFRIVRGKKGWRTYGIGETVKVTLGRFRGLIVEEASARCDVDTFYTARNTDHFNVSRPKSTTSSNYTLLVGFIADVMKQVEIHGKGLTEKLRSLGWEFDSDIVCPSFLINLIKMTDLAVLQLAGSQAPREVLPELRQSDIVEGTVREVMPDKLRQSDIVEGTEQLREKMSQHRAESSQDLTTFLPMQGGEGDHCYAENSRTQADVLNFLLPTLKATIYNIPLLESPKSLVKIADLGWSSGPNSIENMNLVVSLLKSRYSAFSHNGHTPEFQVFFVDLLSNDFNGVFLRLVNQRREGQGSKRPQSSSTVADYFSTGVLGSFYGRLLPQSSIDIVFSSLSLHWLSKIPEAVQDADSPAYNDGFVWIHGGKTLVAQAYAQQAREDMCELLRARAVEMVPGGLMFLLINARKNPDPTVQYDPYATTMFGAHTTMFGKHMEEVFEELVSEGILDREVRDSFNIPIYYRCIDEMRVAIEEVCELAILRMELVDDFPGNQVTQEELRAEIFSSLLGVLVESHMGANVASEIFLRLERRANERSRDDACEERVSFLQVNLVILIRK